MKNNMKKTILAVLLVILCFSFCAAAETVPAVSDALWENAVYLTDTELGAGTNCFTAEVNAGEYAVRFTVHTDADTVGAALLENELIAGEEGEFGLYVKVVNGITADYDIDQSYWAFYINGEYAMTGVDGTAIENGAAYQLVYTK